MADKQASALKLLADPAQRMRTMRDMIALDGFDGVSEREDEVYGIISMTGLGVDVNPLNEEIKGHLRKRQAALADVLKKVGLKFTDPMLLAEEHPIEKGAGPEEIFKACTTFLLRARFVTFCDLLPTTGGGIELEMARRLGKFLLVFHDPRIRTSRMQPDRALHLSVHDMTAQAGDLADIFKYLSAFDPCYALRDGRPVVAGKHQTTGEVVDLDQALKLRWPSFIYTYEGEANLVELHVGNPDIFREYLHASTPPIPPS